MKTTSKISNKIMRRVYMSYALSFTEQPLLWCGLVLGGAVALFGRFTHVASIADNILATPVGNIPAYVSGSFMGAVERGELGTVLVVLIIAVAISVSLFEISKLMRHVSSFTLARSV